MKNFQRNLLSILLILIVPALALWQVSFFANTMKWDMMDYYFPTRYFMSECFANNTLPWWCPYIHLGYPFYADPQSGFWYPFNFLTALTFGYNAFTLQAEFILHLAIAGWGMHKLLQTLGIKWEAALVVGILYPLTGFFIDHATHPTLIISMAWMPFIFHYFILGLREARIIYFVKTGLALALSLTGGYVVFFVLACYIMSLIFLYYSFKYRGIEKYVQRNLTFTLVIALTFLVLCSGYLFSIFQVFPFLKRAEALSLEIANVNSLTLKSLVSFLFPFASLTNTTLFDTDITMRNIYCGLLVIPLMSVAIFHGNRNRNLVLFALSFFCLAAAMGDFLPVRGWLYHTLPFMNMFRHASIFSALSIFGFLMIAADGLSIFFAQYSINAKRTLLLVLLAELVVVGIVVFLVLKHVNGQSVLHDFISTHRISDFVSNSSIFKCLLIQGVVQFVLLVFMFMAFIFAKEKKLALAVSLFWVADLMLASQMNVHGTVVSDNKVSDFSLAVKKMPQGFPVPDINRSVESFGIYGSKEIEPMVWNASILRKEPCSDGFNPFYLKQIASFFNSPVSKFTLKQPEVFLSDRISLLDSIASDSINSLIKSNSIYADKNFGYDNNQNQTSELLLTEFKPGSVIVNTKTERPSFLTLQQCKFEGWKVFIDGKQDTIIKTNYALMSVALPKGLHQVSYIFKPTTRIYFFFAVYIISYITIFGYLLFTLLRRRSFN